MFEAGKNYIENEPYRAPEITCVLNVVWVGKQPGSDNTLCFGFTRPAYSDNNYPWDMWAQLFTPEQLTEEALADFSKNWVEAVWDDSQTTHFWRMKTPEEMECPKNPS